jgi:hypothetical protein
MNEYLILLTTLKKVVEASPDPYCDSEGGAVSAKAKKEPTLRRNHPVDCSGIFQRNL